jgi:hypothetical protein
MKFAWNFQELMEFEQGAPNCTWMTNQLMKIIWSSHFCDFLDLLQKVDLNSFESGFGLFRIGSLNGFDS